MLFSRRACVDCNASIGINEREMVIRCRLCRRIWRRKGNNDSYHKRVDKIFLKKFLSAMTSTLGYSPYTVKLISEDSSHVNIVNVVTRSCDLCHTVKECHVVKNGACCEDCFLILMIKWDIADSGAELFDK